MSGSLPHVPSAPATTSAPAELDSDHAETPSARGAPPVLLQPDCDTGALGAALQEELSVLIGGCEGEAEFPSVEFPPVEAPRNGQSAALLSAFRRKEKDLLVAARLGKALLERNRELNEQSDRMYRELSDKLEQMEQERHELRWRLESREGEWESRVAELEMDVGQLQQEVEIHQARLRELEREKNQAIAELSGQNQKLLEQLSRATEAERLLSAQVQSLREDFEKKSISTDEHMTRLENLQAEIRILSERKRELERRMSAVLAENDVLQAAVDAVQERTLVLEMQCREKDLQLRQIQLDVRDMGTYHEPLGSHFEELSAEEDLLDETEQEEDTQQLWEVQCQVHSLCCQLRGTDTTDPALPPLMPSTQDVSAKRLRGNLMELRGLVQNLLDHSETMDSLCCGGTALETQLQNLREELQEVKELLNREEEQARSSQQEALQLHSQVALLSMELRSARQESESLRAVAGLQEPAEQLLSAMRERDDAVAKKNVMEMELAKCKIDMMSLNSQLLDAIQQKLHLSQQLEAWQDDMVRVIDQQLMDKHQEETRAAPYSFSGRSGTQLVRRHANGDKRLFSFFKKN